MFPDFFFVQKKDSLRTTKFTSSNQLKSTIIDWHFFPDNIIVGALQREQIVIKFDGTSNQTMLARTMLERSIISTTAGKRATWRLVPFVEDNQNHRDIVSGISLSNCVVCQLLRIHRQQTTDHR